MFAIMSLMIENADKDKAVEHVEGVEDIEGRDAIATSMVGCMDLAVELRKRRIALSHLYHALPPYASPAFWQTLSDPALPLEFLARVLREAIARHDRSGRQRISAEIIQRVQEPDLLWARQTLLLFSICGDERQILANDLCADLHECLLRALHDPRRHFWEENFLHSLYFERKHVLRTFMIREGFWLSPTARHGMRVPRSFIASLDVPPGDRDQRTSQANAWEIEDHSAQELFRAVEYSDLLQIVLQLPEKFKAIVLLIFWEGRTEKEVARILAISDRTVRNRLRTALQLLRTFLSTEREDLSHA